MLKTDKYRFERIGVKEGLPHSDVHCALQDRQGYIWFGTSFGISKFDGYKFKSYFTIENSLSSYNLPIYFSFEDSNGTLWFGSLHGILIEYDLNSDCLIMHKILTEKFPDKKSTIITSICEDSFGFLWISTWSRGLYKFDKKSKKVYQINYNKNRILNLILTEEDKLIIATHLHGIDILDLHDEMVENISIEHLGVNPSLLCMYRFSSNKYFIGFSSGLGIFNLNSKKVNTYENPLTNSEGINSICADAEKNLWLSISKGGLIQVENENKNTKTLSSSIESPDNIGNLRINFLFNDRSNVIWICTQGSGIYKVDTIRKQFHSISKFGKEKDTDMVTDLKIDEKNNLWIATFLNDLGKHDLNKEGFTNYNILDSDGNILNYPARKKMFEDSRKNHWLAAGVLFKYSKEKDAYIEHGNLNENRRTAVFTISEYFKDSRHFLLIGGINFGVTCIDTETGSTSEFEYLYKLEPKIKEGFASLLYLDSERNLWIQLLNQKGIFRLSNSGSLVEHNPLNFNPNAEILNIYEDKYNNQWFCTTHGIYKFTKNNSLIFHFDERNGLPINIIRGVVEDSKNNFWLSTTFGIVKFDKVDNCFKNYDYNYGFLNEHFLGSCCMDNNGTLYFGGNKGVDYFNPDEIKDNPYIPNIVITDFQINNETVIPSSENAFLQENINFTKEINLTYKENIFSFEFAALIFNNPKQNQYAYMMEGFDKDWIYCGTRRTATYTNLNPGEYKFRVKGSNNDGVWNEEGTSIKITITPPYWKTWWFKGLGALSLAAATGVAYKNRIDKIEKERKDQEEFSRKLIESQENERKRIAGELHDTIAHEVLIAKNKAEIGLKHSGEKEKVENTLKEISELSSATIKDVRNISYNLHPHQLERLGFTKTIRSIVNDVSNSTDIDFSFESDSIDGHLTKESEINLFRVIQESINNMIKHSDADKAEVKLMISEDYILVMLKDNGKGISTDKNNLNETKGGFGLSGMKERIKYMKGEIYIESEENKGTSIIIRIPVKR